MTELSAAVARIAARPAVRAALTWANGAQEYLATEVTRISEIPAPTFAEGERAAYVRQRFEDLGLEQVELAADGNVYGLLPGEAPEPGAALALFAHIDTVFPADVPVTVTRRDGRLIGPGVGDNGAGVAGMLGAVQALREAGLQPRRPVWIVATVGEEGLGDLNGARAATDRLQGRCDAVIAVEGSFFGRLSYIAVGSRRWRVTARAEGGHSWHDFGRPSAVHALTRAAAAMTRVDVPSEPRTTFNIGEIKGGTGVNVIASQAELVLDMRSLDERQLDLLGTKMGKALEGIKRDGASYTVDVVGNRPAGEIPAGHPLVRTCAAVLQHMGVPPVATAASTDANLPLSRGIPALTLGITNGGGAHTVGDWIEIAPMTRGVQQLVLAMTALAEGPLKR